MPKQTFILPDFIIIGANKAGTTSIANYLREHEQVKISDVKEPMFFSSITKKHSIKINESKIGNNYTALNIIEYSRLFENYTESVTVFGEASTSYLANSSISAPIIRSIVPEAKIIAILREPADRAISAYKMTFGSGIETRSFSEVIKDFNLNNPKKKVQRAQGVKHYFENGFYSQLIKPYYDFIDAEKILIVKYDDLVNEPTSFINKIFHFIGIEERKIDTTKRYNTQDRHLQGKDIFITDEDLKALYEIFYDDVKELSKYIDVKEWLEKYEK